jgi:hypothetical protein
MFVCPQPRPGRSRKAGTFGHSNARTAWARLRALVDSLDQGPEFRSAKRDYGQGLAGALASAAERERLARDEL